MASPSVTQVLYTLQAALDEFWGFSYDTFNFIGTRVFPVVEANVAAGPFGSLPIEEMLKSENLGARAPGSGYYRDRAQFENQEFRTQEYGKEELVDDNDRETWASFHNDPDSFATQRAVNWLVRQREIRVANQLFDTTVFNPGNGNGVNPTALWSNWTTATPVADFEAAAQLHYDNTGQWPNAAVMNRKAFRQVRNTDEVRDRVSSSGAGDQSRATDVTVQQLAEVFDVDMVLVAGGAQNTANVNQAASISQLWGPHCMACTVAMTADMKEPCIGRTIHWSADGSTIDGTVERYREEAKRSDVIRVRHQTDEKLMNVSRQATPRYMGVLIDNVVT